MFGVEICKKKLLKTAGNMLQNITNTVLIQKDNCTLPCQVTFLTLNNLPSAKHSNIRRTFTFKIHPIATLTRSELIYTIWNYIGEFGGWVGLFIGFSVIDLFDLFVSSLQKVGNIFNN